jgi:serine/threonine-protein kinase
MSIDRRSRTLVTAVRSLPLRCPRCGHAASGRPGERCPVEGAALCVAAEIPSKPEPLLGTVLGGRYPVVGVLGRGGMGAVYRGVQEPLGRGVALKVIRPEAALLDDDNPLRRRFFREAQAIAALSHPGIVGLYDYGETTDGLLYMVMELIEGPTLRQVLKEAGRLPAARAVSLVAQVLDALSQAHALGIVHRDLKPGNVMIVGAGTGTSDEHVKLLDFGVAKVFAQDPGLADITQGGSATTLGTPRYMAPEQVVNGEISPQTDLYAVGVLLFALLTGKPPFDGPSAFDIQRLHQEAEVPALPSELAVPARVEAVLRHALEKRPADRPASARAMAAALREAVEAAPAERAVVASVPVTMPADRTPLSNLAELSEPLDETSGHGETLARRPGGRSGGPPRGLFFAGLAVAAAAGGFLLMHLMDAPPAPAPVAASMAPAPPSRTVRAAVPMAADAGVPTAPASQAPAAPGPATRPAAARPAPAKPAARPSTAPAVKVERL